MMNDCRFLLTVLVQVPRPAPLSHTLLMPCSLQRSARPQLLQDVIDLRKRLRGAPTGGTVSIVVTDIQGKSNRVQADFIDQNISEIQA